MDIIQYYMFLYVLALGYSDYNHNNYYDVFHTVIAKLTISVSVWYW